MSNELLQNLRLPFHPADIEWKPGATTKDGSKAMAMAYADVRAYMTRLDDVCGLNWSVTFTPWGDRIVCHLTINGVTRSSTGEPDSQSERSEIAGTAAEAQAFKRACSMFGLGRYLYDFPSVWVEYDKEHRCFTEAGKNRLAGAIHSHYKRVMGNVPLEREQPQHRQPTPAQKVQPAPTDAEMPPEIDYGDNAGATAERTQDAELNPFDDPTVGADAPIDYAAIADSLTGNCRKLADWCAGLHRDGNGPASEKQYGLLVSTIDKATDKAHTAVLSVLCRRLVTAENPPSKDMVSKLLNFVLKQHKPKGADEYVDNPQYRQDYVDCLVSIAKAVKA